MISIIGSPPERKFREITRTDHHSPELVGEIHENLRAFTSLRVLIRDIMHIRVLSDILKMLKHSLRDVHFADIHTQALHEAHCIAMRTSRRTEARHGDSHDAFAVELELVERLDTNEQRQRRVETTTDPDDHRLGMGMHDPFGEPHHLNIEYLLARLLHISARRDKRMGLDITLQHEIVRHGSRLSLLNMDLLMDHAALRIDKRRVAAAVGAKPLHINLCGDKLTL